ncbi:hypothetical protein LCGC14_2839650, partial [marine sediment metagenome]
MSTLTRSTKKWTKKEVLNKMCDVYTPIFIACWPKFRKKMTVVEMVEHGKKLIEEEKFTIQFLENGEKVDAPLDYWHLDQLILYLNNDVWGYIPLCEYNAVLV